LFTACSSRPLVPHRAIQNSNSTISRTHCTVPALLHCNAEEEPAHLEEGGGGGGRGGLKHVEVGKREGKEKEELSK